MTHWNKRKDSNGSLAAIGCPIVLMAAAIRNPALLLAHRRKEFIAASGREQTLRFSTRSTNFRIAGAVEESRYCRNAGVKVSFLKFHRC